MAGEAPLSELVVANLLGELAAITFEMATTSERLTSVAIQLGKVFPAPPPLTDDQAAEIAATWKAKHAGEAPRLVVDR